MAKLFFNNDTITITISNKLSVYGSAGSNDKLIINNSALGSTVNANVETLQFSGSFTDYTFAIAGNQLQVGYQGSVLATVGIQDDSNGTQLAFSDVTTAATLSGLNQAKLGKATLTTSLTSYTNAQLDGTPPVSSGDKAPWTLVMKSSTYTEKYGFSTNFVNVSDGTKVKSLVSPNSELGGFVTSADLTKAYFFVDNHATADQIFKVDGGSLDPVFLADLNFEASTSNVSRYVFNDYELFTVGSRYNIVVTNSNSGHIVSTQLPNTVYNNAYSVDSKNKTIFHTVTSSTFGNELYKTVLTDTGFVTSLVKDIYVGASAGLTGFGFLPASGDKYVFPASTLTIPNAELWVTDGTDVGTFSLELFKNGSGPQQFIQFGDNVVVVGQSYDGWYKSIYLTDGTKEGTKAIYTGSVSSNDYVKIIGIIDDNIYFTAYHKVGFAEYLGFFSANDQGNVTQYLNSIDKYSSVLGFSSNTVYFKVFNDLTGYELWAADLTAELPKLTLVKDINPGVTSSLGEYGYDEVGQMIGDKMLFTAIPSYYAAKAWFVTDGTNAGTVQLSATVPIDKAIIGNKVFFANSAGVSVADVSAATVSATQLKNSVAASGDVLQSDSDQAFFLAGDEKLYVSTGTDAIELASNVDKFKVVAEDAIYFIATNSSNVASLWYSDGTAAGTRYIEDLTMSADSYDLANAVAIHTVGILPAPMPTVSGVGVD